MGSLCGGNQTTTTNTSQSYTPAAMGQLQDLWGRLQSVASTPYTAYGGQMVAGLSGTQQSGIGNVNASYGMAQPYFNTATNYATQGAAPISQDAIARYNNPYITNVVDATRRNFDDANARQQQQVTGNAAMQGALGGDRVAVAQAETARQQRMAQDPIIAGMLSQGYLQSLTAAQADRSAAGQGAFTFGSLGTAAQGAALQGAGAQIQAGGLEQGNEQQRLTAAYNQYLQAQAFPYQQAQFLAATGLPTLTAMGGNQQGTSATTPPTPNPWGQVAGLGLTAAGMFLKDGGRVNYADGGTIGYIPHVQLQPVQQHQFAPMAAPQAPAPGAGALPISPQALTGAAQGIGRGVERLGGFLFPKDSGGKDDVASTMASGYGEGGWNPNVAGGWDPTFGAVNFADGGTVAATPQSDVHRMVSSAVDLARSLRAGIGTGTTQRDPNGIYIPRSGVPEGGPYNTGGGDPYAVAPPMWGPSTPTVRGYEEGGNVIPLMVPVSTQQRINDGFDSLPYAAGTPSVIPSVPMPRPRPAGINPMPAIPAAAAAPQPEPSLAGGEALGFAPTQPQPTNPASAAVSDGPVVYNQDEPNPMDAMADAGGGAGAPPTGASADTAPQGRGWGILSQLGLGSISPDARAGMIAAGLGMMASRHPTGLGQIGEGGLRGVEAYRQSRQQTMTAEQQARALSVRLAQMAETARHNRAGESNTESQRAEQARHNRATEAHQAATIEGGRTPAGYRRDADGNLEFIPGGPADPAHIQTAARARQNSEVSIDAHTLTDMADQYLAGDKSVFQNLGRGSQGSANIVALRQRVAERAREAGMTPDQIATRMADFSGRQAAMRSLGTRGVNVEYAANTANRAIDIADELVGTVPRTQFVPFNRLREMVDRNTSSPQQAAFYAATNTLVNEYARVASGGSNQATEGMRHHAREMLNTAMNPEAYRAVLRTMRREIESAKAAYHETRREFQEDRGNQGHGTQTNPRPALPSDRPAPAPGPAGGAGGSLPRFNTPAEVTAAIAAGRLSRGSKFLDANGNERTVP